MIKKVFLTHYLATRRHVDDCSHHNIDMSGVFVGRVGLFCSEVVTVLSHSIRFVCGISLALSSSVAVAQPRLIDNALNVVTPYTSGLSTTSFGRSLAATGAPRSARGPLVVVGGHTPNSTATGANAVRLHLGPPPNGTSLILSSLPPRYLRRGSRYRR